MPDPGLCSQELDPTLLANTFRLYLQKAGGVEFEVGNIESGDFVFTPELLEHRDGLTNSLDQILGVGFDYTINFTTDSITSLNLSTLLNEDVVNTVEGCKTPLTGNPCVRYYGVRLLKPSPCLTTIYEITFWRAQILAEFTWNFARGEFSTIQGTIRAIKCEAAHPSEPYGQIVELTATCAS
jgi:hypothetical protein